MTARVGHFNNGEKRPLVVVVTKIFPIVCVCVCVLSWHKKTDCQKEMIFVVECDNSHIDKETKMLFLHYQVLITIIQSSSRALSSIQFKFGRWDRGWGDRGHPCRMDGMRVRETNADKTLALIFRTSSPRWMCFPPTKNQQQLGFRVYLLI